MKPAAADTELMARVSRGDVEAYEELFRRHHGALVGFFYRYHGGRSLADDLAQDVFLRLWKYRESYRPTGSFLGYMLTVARNIWCDRISKSAATAIEDEVLDARPAPGPSPDEGAQALETRERVHRALLDLPEALRAPLVLSRFHGLEYVEIGRVLDISPRTVEARIARATDALARRLQAGTVRGAAAESRDAADPAGPSGFREDEASR